MLEAIIRDLSALSERDRAAVLAALSADERARVSAAIRDTPETVPAEPGRHSPWMADLIAGAAEAHDARMTAETRAALLTAAGRAAPPAGRASGRSLLQAAGDAFAQARGR